MDWETVIGIEVHCQLSVPSKLFCECSTAFGADANTNVCPVCLGLPGSLPVISERALRLAIRAGLALRCEIASRTKWDRKNYFYPDLPKGYQISQYDMPLSTGGTIEVPLENGTKKTVRITRLHLEEDTGKLFHTEDGDAESLVDLNRAGTPLIEIVTEPDIRSADEAWSYLTELRRILRYIDVSDCNMEEGSLRAEPNVSIRPLGAAKFGVKTEIKNLNSFKSVRDALTHEVERQRRILESGGVVRQETLLWDVARGVTAPMRSKESAHDYRYFPEPDIPPVTVAASVVDAERRALPELPGARRARFEKDLALPAYDADVLCSDRATADYFEAVVKACPRDPKAASNWVMGEVLREAKERKVELHRFPVAPEKLGELIGLVSAGTISVSAAKEAWKEMVETGAGAKAVVERRGLAQVSDAAAIDAMVAGVIAANEKIAGEVRGGKIAALKSLVGLVMRESKGKANPQMVNAALRRAFSLPPE